MNNSNFEMSILVDNKPITEYYHNGSTFVEGRSGNDYKIRVRNNNYAKACFIVSVDGLSVLDGKECGDNSPGYIVEPRATLDIACYKVDEATGAKFVFGSKDKSYSAEIGKGTDNVGVIALRVFRERPNPIVHHHSLRNTKGIARALWATGTEVRLSSARAASASPGRGWGMEQSGNIASNSAGSQSLKSTPDIETFDAGEMEDTKLGTQFGESMSWETRTVSFDREAYPACSLIIYYDTRKNLERRGIRFDHQAPPLPNPFPADTQGCPVPTSWKR